MITLGDLKTITMYLLGVFLAFKENAIVEAQHLHQINVLFTNEAGNLAAARAVDSVVEYLRSNPYYGILPVVTRIEGKRTEHSGFSKICCNRYSDMIDEKESPHIIFDTTKSAQLSRVVKGLTRQLALPTVSASFGRERDVAEWMDLSEEEQKYLIQVTPPADLMTEVLRSLALYRNSTTMVVLHDESFVLYHKYRSLFNNLPIRGLIKELRTPDELKAQLKALRNLRMFSYIALGSYESINMALDQAVPDDTNRSLSWMALTPFEEGVLNIKYKNMSVLLLKPRPDPQCTKRLETLRSQYHLYEQPIISSAFYFDLALRTFLAIREMINLGMWPSRDMQYLKCDEHNDENDLHRDIELLQYFKQVTEPTSYGTFQFPTNPDIPFNGNSYMNFDLDLFVETSGNESEHVGVWKAGYDLPIVVGSADRYRNLTTETLYKIFTVVQPPFVVRDPNSTRGYTGYCVAIMDKIAEYLNFNYTLEEDEEFGSVNENGEWSHIIGKLIRKEADIAMGSLAVSAEREMVIDFSVPYYDLVGISIMMRRPRPPSSLFKFLDVLEYKVWVCILIGFFITSIMLYGFNRWSPFSLTNNREYYKDDEEQREFNLKECLWYSMTSLTPQGGGESPKNLSGLIVAATWWLFGFIIVASYTANLAAFLTVARLDTPMKSLNDLHMQYKIQYAPINGSATMQFFERMAAIETTFYDMWLEYTLNDSLSVTERSFLAVWEYPITRKYTQILEAIRISKPPNSLEEAVERVLDSDNNNKFAFIGDAADIKHLIMHNCELEMIGEEFSQKPYAMGVQENSELRNQLDNAILTLLNTRDLENFKQIWWKKNQRICDQLGDQIEGITLESISGVFLTVYIGVTLACLYLVAEKAYEKYKNRRRAAQIAEMGEAGSVSTIEEQLPEEEVYETHEDRRFTTEEQVNVDVHVRHRFV